MPSAFLTQRSQFIHKIVPAVHTGIRVAHLRPHLADDAFQQTLLALAPRLDWLAGLPDDERFAYVFTAAKNTAMGMRKKHGKEHAYGTADEVRAWDRQIKERTVTPEQVLVGLEGAKNAQSVFEELDTIDQRLLRAVSFEGKSEREAAAEIGIPRGTAANHLRKIRDRLLRASFETVSRFARKKKKN